MIILGIESSCDDTGIALVKNGKEILVNKIASQIKSHAVYGGVVPELASRKHTEVIHLMIKEALEATKLTFEDINAIAVTQGPGLEGSLLIGLTVAKTLASLLHIPLIPVNHLHGHIYANFVKHKATFPTLGMLVSGGHTLLLKMTDHFKFEIIGQTRDDAAGEAFDKIARVLELGYPGGPIVEKRAKNGNSKAFNFPRAMKHDGYDFSFSGLKTAFIQTVKKLDHPLPTDDLCASFQAAVTDILIYKSLKACEKHGCKNLILAGGVTANQFLKGAFETACEKHNIKLMIPEPILCTDNGAMIAVAGFYQALYNKNLQSPKVKANLSL